MSGFNVLREYLINIKTAIDHKSAQDALKNIDENMKKTNKVVEATQKIFETFSNSTVTKMGVAGASFMAFSVAVTASTGKIISDVARADMEIQKFQRRMFTSLPNAYSLRTSMEAMGLQGMEDLKDVALNPELRERFLKLRGQASQMMPGGDFEGQMRKVRDIEFEFTRMKLETTFAFQQISYSFMKNLAGPFSDFQKSLKSFNDYISKNMPNIGNNIAKFFEIFVRDGMVIIKTLMLGVKFIGDVFNLLNKMPNVIKEIGIAAGALFLILKTGPLGWLIAGLQTLFLLLDDIFTYAEGGKSLFGKFYKDFYDQETGKTTKKGKVITATVKGAATGAVIGSVVPVVGTGTGAVAGAVVGTGYGLVKENFKYTQEVMAKFMKNAKNMANITSSYRPWDKNSGHSKGIKFDVGLAGTSMQKQASLYKNLMDTKGIANVNFESNSMADKAKYNNLRAYLNSIHSDTSKLHWLHNPKATGLHYDVKTSQVNHYNIKSNDPKGVRREIEAHNKQKISRLTRTIPNGAYA